MNYRTGIFFGGGALIGEGRLLESGAYCRGTLIREGRLLDHLR